jgi:L-malate glycosyltransferase
MKILQVILPVGLGGVERIVSMLSSYGNNIGDDVCIAVGESYREKFCDKFKLNDRSKIFSLNDKNLLSAFLDIVKVVKKIEPDIIHTHARRECFLVSLLAWKIKHIRTQHMAESPKLKVSWLEKKLINSNVDVWVATSHKLVDDYLKSKAWIDDKKVEVIYNGIDVDTVVNSRHERKYKFCIISRLSKQKGIDILLDKIHEMPLGLQERIYIDIWGEGEEKEELIKQIHSYGLEKNIVYKGVTYNPIEILGKYDALLMPSRYEGLPLTMLESMAMGTPVAIHDVGCVNEFLRTGNNGWIIDSQYDWYKFFEDILDPMYDFENISTRVMATYQQYFLGEFMCGKYRQVYQRTLEE